MAAKGTDAKQRDQQRLLGLTLLTTNSHPCLFDVCVYSSSRQTAVLSVPVKLLKEGEGHMVTVELKTGEVYRGLLVESEDTMNLHLSEGACDAAWSGAMDGHRRWARGAGDVASRRRDPTDPRRPQTKPNHDSDAHGPEREGVETGAGLPAGLPSQVRGAARDTKERACLQKG